MTRRVAAVLCFAFGWSTLHCSSEPSAQPCEGESCDGGSSGQLGAGSSGDPGSSGQPGTSSGQPGSSGGASSGDPGSSGGPDPDRRIPRLGNLPQRSAGCGNANAPGRGQARALASGRQYIPYQGQGYSAQGLSAERGYPVLIALHGCGANAPGFSAFANLYNTVGNEGIVVYGQDSTPNNGDCGWDPKNTAEVDYLDAVIDDVAAQYCVDSTRVGILGYSWGSYMAHTYACNRPGKVNAVLGTAGGFPDGAPNTASDTCGQVHSLIYGRTHDRNEFIDKSYNARDRKVAINQCGGGSQQDQGPFSNSGDANVKPCTDYLGCAGGLRTTFCEDPYDLATLPGGNNDWNHTFWQVYHQPVWNWFKALP